MNQLYVVFGALIISGRMSCVVAHQPSQAFAGPIRVYAGEGIDLDSTQTAIDWFNEVADQECLLLIPGSWPFDERGGVISIEVGTCAEGLQGCVSYDNYGPLHASIKIVEGHKLPEDLLIAHELAHPLTNANNDGHTAVEGVMANPPNAWDLPPRYRVNVDYACETKTMAAAIAKKSPTRSVAY